MRADDGGNIDEINRIIHELDIKYADTGIICKTGEIFPTNNAPVLSLIDGKPALSIMKWGFPKWDGKGTIINAKSETAHEKKMFAKPLMEKRCVIPSTGFYEWQKKVDTKRKDKYLFSAENSPMLYMAGIYNVFKNNDGLSESFVILTRIANRYINDIHDRMPVVLYKDELVPWLKDEGVITAFFAREDVVLERKLAG